MDVQVAVTPSLCDVIDATSFCCFYFYKGMADATVIVDVIHTAALIVQLLEPTSSNRYKTFTPEFIDDHS